MDRNKARKVAMLGARMAQYERYAGRMLLHASNEDEEDSAREYAELARAKRAEIDELLESA